MVTKYSILVVDSGTRKEKFVGGQWSVNRGSWSAQLRDYGGAVSWPHPVDVVQSANKEKGAICKGCPPSFFNHSTKPSAPSDQEITSKMGLTQLQAMDFTSTPMTLDIHHRKMSLFLHETLLWTSLWPH